MSGTPGRGDATDVATADQSPGEAALATAIDEHGEELAALLDRSEQVGDLLDLVVLTLAAAEDEQVDAVTDSLVALVEATEHLSTAEAVALADAVGTNGESLARALQTVVQLERSGALADLVALAETTSALDLDAKRIHALNDLLCAVGEAERTADPAGPLDVARSMREAEFRTGLGYLLAVVRALGRRLRAGD